MVGVQVSSQKILAMYLVKEAVKISGMRCVTGAKTFGASGKLLKRWQSVGRWVMVGRRWSVGGAWPEPKGLFLESPS